MIYYNRGRKNRGSVRMHLKVGDNTKERTAN